MGRVYLHVHDRKYLIVMIFVSYYFWQFTYGFASDHAYCQKSRISSTLQ